MCSRLNHEYSLSMLCSSSGKVAAGTGGEEEVDGVSLCVSRYVCSRKRYGFEGTKRDH